MDAPREPGVETQWARRAARNGRPVGTPASRRGITALVAGFVTVVQLFGLTAAEASAQPAPSSDADPPAALSTQSRASRIHFGISEQDHPDFLANPGFQNLRVTAVRNIVSWDVGLPKCPNGDPWAKSEWARLNEYVAKAGGLEVMVSLGPSKCGRRPPSKVTYRRAVRRVVRHFSSQGDQNKILYWAAWNESNSKRAERLGGSTRKSARHAARYFVELSRLCRKTGVGRGSCKGVVAGDLAQDSDLQRQSRYLKVYQDELERRLKRRDDRWPLIWGFHPYGDVERRLDRGTRAFVEAVKTTTSAKAGRNPVVWLTEAGSRVRGRPSNIKCPRGESAEECQKKDAAFLVNELVRVPHIGRVFWYHYMLGHADWDSGLADPTGTRRRPAYEVFCKRTNPFGNCHA